MSKYDPLKQFLLSSCKDSINMSFSEIESILGFSLPISASKYDVWWKGNDHTQANSWLYAGYRVGRISRHESMVCFYRV